MDSPCINCIRRKTCTSDKMCKSYKFWFTVKWHQVQCLWSGLLK
nr:MAG TPA: hypothetical protein [Microviridae sp.]